MGLVFAQKDGPEGTENVSKQKLLNVTLYVQSTPPPAVSWVTSEGFWVPPCKPGAVLGEEEV